MRHLTRLTLAAATLAASTTLALAQTPQDHAAHHPAPPATAPMRGGTARPDMAGMMTGNMAQMMSMMATMMPHGMVPMGQPRHVEGQIAFYKAELRITDAQLPQWNAFADALRNAAARQRQMVTPSSAASPTAAPDQMERRIALLSARLDVMKALLDVARPLYAALTDEQKRTADELFAEHVMMHGNSL
jgi:hypothetical protein